MSSPLPVTIYLCRNCGWADFHPASSCPRCNGEIGRSDIAGEGNIVTFTTIRYPPRGFESQAPYVVAIIDIKKGPRVIGRILKSADEVKIGDSVTLTSFKAGVLEFLLSSAF